MPSRPTGAPAPAASTPRPAPVTQTGPGGWTAAGGAPVTVGQGDSLAVLATRYGIPERAILSANGLSSGAQVTPGRQIVIPVYDAGAQAQATPAARTPRADQPKPRLAETPKPAAKAEAKTVKVDAKADADVFGMRPALQNGSEAMQLGVGVSADFVFIMQGLVLFLMAFRLTRSGS